jgi:acylglycerol lipase
MLLMTSVMTPRKGDIKAVVCFCHGYTDNCSFSKRMECQRLVKAGIAFVTIEYEGHGRSDGPLGLISDWDELIDDVTQYFQHVVVDDKRFRNLPVFLMGESMGGAVSYSVYNRIPHVFRGVIFVCPMCKISDDMLPPGYVIDFLKWIIGPTGTTSLLGYLPIAPSRNNLSDVTHRVPEKAAMLSRCPTVFGRNPRLATARELIRVTQRISNNLSDFDAPFLVLHGKADRVTDPDLSQALYDESKSTDKSIQLYDGMWHSLTGGEPDENVDRVFNDIIAWIEERS